MAIQAVVFDVGGVLLTLGEQDYRREVADRLGLPALPPEYQRQVPALQRGEIAEESVWAALAGRPVASDAFDAAWLRHYRPVPAMLALAADLRARGLRTAVLSNTQASHVRLMRGMGFLADFDPVVMSCEAGCRKPEPAAFRYVLDRAGLPARATAYVDDVPEFVAAAQVLGIHAIHHAGDPASTRRRVLDLLTAGRHRQV